MKKNVALGTSIILAFLISFGGACTANKTAYTTVGSLATAVDLAMNTWGAYVRATRATNPVNSTLDSQEAQVRKVFDYYQATMKAAQGALNSSTWNGTAPTSDILAAAQAVIGLIPTLIPKQVPVVTKVA